MSVCYRAGFQTLFIAFHNGTIDFHVDQMSIFTQNPYTIWMDYFDKTVFQFESMTREAFKVFGWEEDGKN